MQNSPNSLFIKVSYSVSFCRNPLNILLILLCSSSLAFVSEESSMIGRYLCWLCYLPS